MNVISLRGLVDYALLQINIQMNGNHARIGEYLKRLSAFGSDLKTIEQNIGQILSKQPYLNRAYEKVYSAEMDRYKTESETLNKLVSLLNPNEKEMMILFMDALKKQQSSHGFEMFENPGYAMEISRYLHKKAIAELRGESFEQDSNLERHIAGCEYCQEFYSVTKEAMPVLKWMETQI